jgi:hypothetical protein
MPKHRFVLVAALAMAFVVVPPALARQQPPPQGGQEEAPPPEIRLLDAGQSPHRALRFTIDDEVKERATIRMKVESQTTMNGQPMPSPVPQMEMVVAAVTKPAPGGDTLESRMMFEDVRLLNPEVFPEQVRPMLEQNFDALEKLEYLMAFDRRGVLVKAETLGVEKLAPAMRASADQMASQMRQMSALLPQEPIGVGGRWQVTQDLPMPALRLRQTATYEVKAIDGDRISLKVSLVQEAPAQTMQNGMRLTSFEGKGDGTLVVDLARITPAEGEIRSTNSMSFDMNGMAMKTDTAATMTLEGELTGE